MWTSHSTIEYTLLKPQQTCGSPADMLRSYVVHVCKHRTETIMGHTKVCIDLFDGLLP